MCPFKRTVGKYKYFLAKRYSRDLTLDELLRELRDGAELSQSTWPDSGIEITIFPPTNDILTVEDSGEEDCGDINNLPGAQLNASAKLNIPAPYSDDDDSIYNIIMGCV